MYFKDKVSLNRVKDRNINVMVVLSINPIKLNTMIYKNL